MAYGGYGSGPLDTAYGNLDQLGSLAGLFGAGGPGGGAGLHGGKVSTASALAAAGAAEHGQAGSTLGDMPHDDNASYMAADDLQEDQGEPLGQQETEGEPGAGGEVGHGEGQQQQEEAPPPPMTQTIAMGIQDMDAQLANIESKIQELTNLAVQRLDHIKDSLIREMTRFIQDLHDMRGMQHNRWLALAAETLQESERLGTARALVGRLGLHATQAPAEEEGFEDGGNGEGQAMGMGMEDGMGQGQ